MRKRGFVQGCRCDHPVLMGVLHAQSLYSHERTPRATRSVYSTRLNTGVGILRCTLPPTYIPTPMPGKAQRNNSSTNGVTSRPPRG